MFGLLGLGLIVHRFFFVLFVWGGLKLHNLMFGAESFSLKTLRHFLCLIDVRGLRFISGWA